MELHVKEMHVKELHVDELQVKELHVKDLYVPGPACRTAYCWVLLSIGETNHW